MIMNCPLSQLVSGRANSSIKQTILTWKILFFFYIYLFIKFSFTTNTSFHREYGNLSIAVKICDMSEQISLDEQSVIKHSMQILRYWQYIIIR